MRTAVITVCAAAAIAAHAQRINLESYARNLDSIPIGIVAFRARTGPALHNDEPWKVLAADLSFSGRFTVVRMARFDSAAMDEARAGLFIDGEYSRTGESVVLDCYLHDAVSMDLIFGKKYRGETTFLRRMAHRFANRLVEMLFGDRGIFETKIMYVTGEGAVKNLAVADYDGRGGKQLTRTSTVNVFPVFADPRTILWVSFLRGKPDIYRGSISRGTQSIFLYSRYIETSPSVSRIDGRVAFASSRKGNMDIYVCDGDGSALRRCTLHRGIDTSPSWSPNGYRIAFTSDRSGQPQIYIMDSDGANIRRLTFEGGYNDSPAWSPRGDKIAYCSRVRGKFDIHVIGPEGGKPERVTEGAGHNEYPCWSPDGNHILFGNRRGGKSSLYTVREDGSNPRRLPLRTGAAMPDWSPFEGG